MAENDKGKTPPTPELSPEEASRKRRELARQQEEAARQADEREQNNEDATVSTFILPGD